MFSFLLCSVAVFLSTAVLVDLTSRAAFGNGALVIVPLLSLHSAFLLGLWLERRRRTELKLRGVFSVLVSVVLFGGVMAMVRAKSGDNLGVSSLPLLVVGLFVLTPLAVFVGRWRRDRSAGQTQEPRGTPRTLDVFRALMPVALMALLPAVLKLSEVPQDLEGKIMMNGLTGLLYAEFAVYGPFAAMILGLGLDQLEGPQLTLLARRLLLASTLALLVLAVWVPYQTTLASMAHYADSKVIREPFDFDAVRHSAPLFLLALSWLVHDQLGALVRGQRALGWNVQLGVLLSVCGASFLLTRSLGLAVVTVSGTLVCTLALFVGRSLRSRS